MIVELEAAAGNHRLKIIKLLGKVVSEERKGTKIFVQGIF